ncbi:MAG: homoserine dehydrogenase, partial [Fusobacterium sp.]|nr:homoserine dehydrogenase [Fusobacterium sp.]
LKSEFLGESSYIGQGAGKFATAHAVVQDIVSIYENRNLSFPISEKIEIVNEVSSNFYIRSKNLNKFNHIIEEKIDDETIITKYIRLKDIKDFIDKDTFIAEFRLYLQE